jgi:hypothetical protein
MELNMEIEQEVKARVDFKMQEFFTALKNVASNHWGTAFHSSSQKHQHYWEAFEQMQAMFKKEWHMATPYNDMAKRKKWEAKEKAVDEIVNALDLRGTPNIERKIKIIVKEIENAQNYE